jgi:hypothetical protein
LKHSKGSSNTAKIYRVYSIIERPKNDDYWLNIGVAFPHEDGKGFNVMLQGLPLHGNGKIALREHEVQDHETDEIVGEGTALPRAGHGRAKEALPESRTDDSGITARQKTPADRLGESAAWLSPRANARFRTAGHPSDNRFLGTSHGDGTGQPPRFLALPLFKPRMFVEDCALLPESYPAFFLPRGRVRKTGSTAHQK